MQDILKDIVSHTHNLGFISLIKVDNTGNETVIDAVGEEKRVMLKAKTHTKIDGFKGIFGMPNLSLLSLLLKNPEYEEGKISVVEGDRNGVIVPTNLHFENQTSSYENDYRFMNQNQVEEFVRKSTFKGATWKVELEPSIEAITRLKLQAAVHPTEEILGVSTGAGNLIFSFGDQSTHAGKFLFATDIEGVLNHTWTWPIKELIAILSLTSKLTMCISDEGIMKISADSGLACYDYLVPAMMK